MRIGFDISQTGTGKAGCGFYAHALAQRLVEAAVNDEFLMLSNFGDFYFDPTMVTAFPYKGKNVSYGPRFVNRDNASRYWCSANTEVGLNLNVIHGNNFWCPSNFHTTRVIYTLYDLGFVIDPSWTTEANRLGCFDGIFRASLHADWIVSISKNSAREFLATFPQFPEDRMRVLYPCSRFSGAETGSKPPRSVTGVHPRQFWVSVGTIEPRKNQKMLIKAYANYLAVGGEPMPLVLAGGKGWLMDDLGDFIASLGITQNVILTGYVSDSELVWLYQNCFANLYPSLYEGFGLPVLEGMQFGAGVLSSCSSSLPEVVGAGGIMIDPHDCGGWTDKMLKLAAGSISVDQLREAAKKQAARFSWSTSASSLIDLYSTAVASPKRQAYS